MCLQEVSDTSMGVQHKDPSVGSGHLYGGLIQSETLDPGVQLVLVKLIKAAHET